MGMLNCNPTELSMPAGTVLKDADEHELLDDDESGLYRQIVGSTIYLCNNTRPDIAYPVGQLARFMSKPGEPHLKMAKQLLRYLKGTQNLGIKYGIKQETEQYSAWTDATWGTETDRKSFQGYVVIWYGGTVSWAVNRQKSTALSSMEAECQNLRDRDSEFSGFYLVFGYGCLDAIRRSYLSDLYIQFVFAQGYDCEYSTSHLRIVLFKMYIL
ncbi:hypothetical protein K3495_g8733 [Podosphaera aphanis]|nr:hypothetical protein K3495_g8733 [Podosphaera aphanis]